MPPKTIKPASRQVCNPGSLQVNKPASSPSKSGSEPASQQASTSKLARLDVVWALVEVLICFSCLSRAFEWEYMPTMLNSCQQKASCFDSGLSLRIIDLALGIYGTLSSQKPSKWYS